VVVVGVTYSSHFCWHITGPGCGAGNGNQIDCRFDL
jgi:hypothetical protein